MYAIILRNHMKTKQPRGDGKFEKKSEKYKTKVEQKQMTGQSLDGLNTALTQAQKKMGYKKTLPKVKPQRKV